MLLQSCDGQGKACYGTRKDRSLWAFFREKFCNYLDLIIVWHFWVIFCRRNALTEPKAFGGENKLPHKQKNCCNSPGEFSLSKKPLKKIPSPSPWAGRKGNRIGHFSGTVSPQDCMNHDISQQSSSEHFSSLHLSLQMHWRAPSPATCQGWLQTPSHSCSKLGSCWNQWTWFFAGLGFQQKQPHKVLWPVPDLTPIPAQAGTDCEGFCAQLKMVLCPVTKAPAPHCHPVLPALRLFKNQ